MRAGTHRTAKTTESTNQSGAGDVHSLEPFPEGDLYANKISHRGVGFEETLFVSAVGGLIGIWLVRCTY